MPHEPPAGVRRTAASSGTGHETLFDWRRRNRSLRLPIYLLISIVILSLFFYLFQVTYPTPERTLPRTQEITLLTPSDPAARGLLTRITDRTIALALPLAPMQDAFDWSDISVRLQPSFQQHRFRAGSIVEVTNQTELPELLSPGSLRRPSVTLPATPTPLQPDGRREVIWRPHPVGGLAGWQVVEAPSIQPPQRLLLDLPALEFTAGVDADGRVRFLMPLGQGDAELEQQVWRHSHLIRLAAPAPPESENGGENESPPSATKSNDLIWGILRWQTTDL